MSDKKQSNGATVERHHGSTGRSLMVETTHERLALDAATYLAKRANTAQNLSGSPGEIRRQAEDLVKWARQARGIHFVVGDTLRSDLNLLFGISLEFGRFLDSVSPR
jgi:hypothetical protein